MRLTIILCAFLLAFNIGRAAESYRSRAVTTDGYIYQGIDWLEYSLWQDCTMFIPVNDDPFLTTADYSINNNHGTIGGHVVAEPLNSGYCFSSIGSNASDVVDFGVLDYSSYSSLTISFWFRAQWSDYHSGSHIPFANTDTNTTVGVATDCLQTDTNVYLHHGGERTGTEFTTGLWYHVVGEFVRGDYFKGYLNGQPILSEVDVSANNYALCDAAKKTTLLGIVSANRAFAGYVDNLKTFDAVLSARQKYKLWQDGDFYQLDWKMPYELWRSNRLWFAATGEDFYESDYEHDWGPAGNDAIAGPSTHPEQTVLNGVSCWAWDGNDRTPVPSLSEEVFPNHTNEFSIALWIKPANAALCAIMGYEQWNDNGFRFTSGDSDGIKWYTTQSGGTIDVHKNSIVDADNPWMHVCVTHNGEGEETWLYIDGVQEDYDTGYMIPRQAWVNIGAGIGGLANFTGYMDNVSIALECFSSNQVYNMVKQSEGKYK